MSKSTPVNCVCASAPDIDCRHCDGLGVAKQVGTDLRPLTLEELYAAAEASVKAHIAVPALAEAA